MKAISSRCSTRSSRLPDRKLVPFRHDAGAESPNGFKQFLSEGATSRRIASAMISRNAPRNAAETSRASIRGSTSPLRCAWATLRAAMSICAASRSASACAADGSRSCLPTMMRASGSSNRKSISLDKRSRSRSVQPRSADTVTREHRVVIRVVEIVDDGCDQAVLGTEVAVEQPRGDLGARGDVGYFQGAAGLQQFRASGLEEAQPSGASSGRQRVGAICQAKMTLFGSGCSSLGAVL